MKIVASITLLVLFILSAESIAAVAVSPQTEARCYKIKIHDSPENSTILTLTHFETWCYENRTHEGQPVLYAYNADAPTVRPELAFLVDQKDQITHVSLAADERTVHRVSRDEYQPFSIPMTEPSAADAALDFHNIWYLDPAFRDSAHQVFADLTSASAETHSLRHEISSLRATTLEASARLPWRGYWWSYKMGHLARGSDSPLAKYDRHVQTISGASPGAAAWERANHVYKGVWWEGHCNGWAASAILRSEPRTPRVKSGMTFKVSDQKGLLAATDYCASSAFFGSRYRGTGDRRDIYPHKLHNTLLYYIGSLRKAVAVDYRSDRAVDNHIISGYSMVITPTSSNTLNVTNTVTVHKYDGARYENPGIAPTYNIVYRYNLKLDANGVAVGGTWLSVNPDFLWVPLASIDCPRNNPAMAENWVRSILYE